MPINFVCPHCNFQSLVADEYLGQTGPCSQCGQQITISQGPANPYASPTQQQNPQRPMSPGTQGPQKRPDLGTRMLIPVDRSALSIIAGYMGLFSILCIPAPLAILLGGLAIWDIKKSNGKKHGMGRAWFAVGAGLFFMIAFPILMYLLTTSNQPAGFNAPAYK